MRVLILAALLAALLAAGCSGEGESVARSSTTLTTAASTTTLPRFSAECRSSHEEAAARGSDPTRFLPSVQACGSVTEWVAAAGEVGTVKSSTFELGLRALTATCGFGDAGVQRRPICVEARDLTDSP